jgi:CHAT domain-containing protein
MHSRTRMKIHLSGHAAFKSMPLGDLRVIHLAAHGVADSQFPDRAALVLGKTAATVEDGLLVREIRDLSLNAELVTLSACDTGNGRLLGEEGIASLERAFLFAGAKSVIASLWTADDNVHDRSNETSLPAFGRWL